MFPSQALTSEDSSFLQSSRRNSLNIDFDQYEEVVSRYKRAQYREISTNPYRILDAPGIIDDFYLNILDWSSNFVSVALDDSVYIYNVFTKQVDLLYTAKNSYISSVKGKDNFISIGCSDGKIKVFDLCKNQMTYIKKIHNTRVSSLAYHTDFLTTGVKSGQIFNVDFRQNDVVSELVGHKAEICGLKWNKNGSYLASGSNDNSIRIWRSGRHISSILKGHNSAVKALDWCNWQDNVLCSGGGSQDKTIRMWDVISNTEIRKIETDSQVCTLHCLENEKELITSHGYCNNDLKLWRFSDMRLIKSFGRHESRILHTDVSPDQTSLVSLAPDDNLKFWRISENEKEDSKNNAFRIFY